MYATQHPQDWFVLTPSLKDMNIEARACDEDLETYEFVSAETGERVYWSHGIVRFHPGDAWTERDTTNNSFQALDLSAFQTGDAPVRNAIIMDSGAHGIFSQEIVERMTGHRPDLIEMPQNAPAAAFGFFVESTVLDAIDRVDPGLASVINMSFGTVTCNNEPPPLLADAIASKLDAHGGLIIVASAGNDSSDRPSWPAALPDVIAVGALADDITRACFSNYNGDFGAWVDAWAPGQEVSPSATSGQWSGTSFAAPQVTAALVAMDKPDLLLTQPADPQLNQEVPYWLDVSNDDELNQGSTFCGFGSDYWPAGAEPQ